MTKIEEIRAIVAANKEQEEQRLLEVEKFLTNNWCFDLTPHMQELKELAKTSKAMWDKKNGQKQVQNSIQANLTGHCAELAVYSYFKQYIKDVTAPDLDAYRNNTEETSKYDVLINDKGIQVKGISKLKSQRFQVTTYNVEKYVNDGSEMIVFVYIDTKAEKAYIYGAVTPKEMFHANDKEENDQGRSCYSAKDIYTTLI